MGNWENTTYIEHGDASQVAECLAALFAGEGMQQIARPAPREPLRYDPMQYRNAVENNLWGIAVFPGSPGWTVIKTAPFELLGERAAQAGRMRLAELAARLDVAGFQVNLYDSSALVLVEADRHGRCLLSGFKPVSDTRDPLRFHEEQITEDRIDVRFELLPFQTLVEECSSERYGGGLLLDDDELVARLARKLGGANAGWCSNSTCVEALIPHRPLIALGGIELYFEWPARDRIGSWVKASD
jgi:hypothetical protein